MTKRNVTGWKSGTAAFFLGWMVLLMSACGGGSGGSDEQQITRLVKDFFEESISGDASKAYDMLDSATRAECSKEDFIEESEFAQEFFEAIGSKFEVKRVYDIKVNGDTATARIDVTVDGESSDAEADEARFRREGGKWKIAEAC